jgi:hypothetical protein
MESAVENLGSGSISGISHVAANLQVRLDAEGSRYNISSRPGKEAENPLALSHPQS